MTTGPDPEIGAVAPTAIRSQAGIVRTLRTAQATSPQTATALTAPQPVTQGALASLLKRGAVVAAGDLYWLDETAYTELRNLRSTRLILSLFGIAAVILIVGAVTIAKADSPVPALSVSQPMSQPVPHQTLQPASSPDRPETPA